MSIFKHLNNLYIPIAFQQIRIEINKTISCLKDIFPLASSEDIKQLESELLGDFVLLTDMEGGKADTIYKKEDIIDFGLKYNINLNNTEK